MTDITTLAQTLGISPQAVRDRIAKLGIVPEQIKPSKGRAKAMLSDEQVQMVASYATTTATIDDAEELLESVADEAATATALATQHYSQVIGALAHSVETQATDMEDRIALAIATRLDAIAPRAFTKAISRITGKPAPIPTLDIGLELFRPQPILPPTATENRIYADNIF